MLQQRAAEGCCDVSPREPNQPTISTPYRFSIQGHHVMFCLSLSCCVETLCEEVVQLLVQGILVCARSRTRIELLRNKSRGTRLYQTDLLDED
jgi:hypothetical protein